MPPAQTLSCLTPPWKRTAAQPALPLHSSSASQGVGQALFSASFYLGTGAKHPGRLCVSVCDPDRDPTSRTTPRHPPRSLTAEPPGWQHPPPCGCAEPCAIPPAPAGLPPLPAQLFSLESGGASEHRGLVCPSCRGDGAGCIRCLWPGPWGSPCFWPCEEEGVTPFFPQAPAHPSASPTPCALYFSLSRTSRGFFHVQPTLYYRLGLAFLLPPAQDLLAPLQAGLTRGSETTISATSLRAWASPSCLSGFLGAWRCL